MTRTDPTATAPTCSPATGGRADAARSRRSRPSATSSSNSPRTGSAARSSRVEKRTSPSRTASARGACSRSATGSSSTARPSQLVAPTPKAPAGRLRTASGSFAVASAPARVALPSRIFVEGRHDAELVEKVWGADLRVEGVVVEYLEGVDVLDGVLDEFRPGPGPSRRHPRRPPRAGLEGAAHRRRGRPRPARCARARGGASVHRRLAGGEARPPRPRRRGR